MIMKYKIAKDTSTIMIASALITIALGIWEGFIEALIVYNNQGLKILVKIAFNRLIVPFVLMYAVIRLIIWVFETIEEERLNKFKKNKSGKNT